LVLDLLRKTVPADPTVRLADPQATASIPAPPGEVPPLPGYEILGRLGRGGMGVVYRARQTRLNRLVALKRIRPETERDLARSRTEAEALARLGHPNIVQIHEVLEHEGSVYLVLELVEGGSLADWLGGLPQPPREAAALLEAVAGAVHSAHAQGIIHRDLKPANILLSLSRERPASADSSFRETINRSRLNECVPKVTDFGIAKRLSADSGGTREGDLLGTPAYMAPEQAVGRLEQIGPPTDVYGLGCVLYEMLTGRVPLLGETALDTLLLTRTEEPIPPRRLQPKVPRDLETICLKCLEKDPQRRYASAQALADDLRRYLAHEPIRARPAGRAERLLKWARRRPAVAALTVCLALLTAAAAAGGALYNVRLRRERDRAEQNLAVARGAVEKMLLEVAEEELNTEPRMEEKRRRLLEQALAFYEDLLREQGDDPALRREIAVAQLRVGDIRRLLGDHARAEEAYSRAIVRLKALCDDFPARPEFRRRLADAFNFRGEVFRLTSRPADARADYEAARALQERLATDFPDSPDYKSDLARTHYNEGIVLKDDGEREKARQELDEAVALLAPLADAPGARPEPRQHLARAYLNRAAVLRAGRRPAEARDDCSRAISLLDGLAAADPLKPDYRFELAVAHANRGNALAQLSAPEAEEDYREALRLLGLLAGDFPRVPAYPAERANTWNSLGALLAVKSPDEAAKCWGAAGDLLRKLIDQFPRQATYHGDLGITLSNLGRLALKRGRPKDALGYLEEGVRELRTALEPDPSRADYAEALRRALQALETARGQT
ncbi:MAG TPA: serine/threonine-protein kinase, partial [Gemmataceae bacterium]|nr:serine/threonine-protein kinase [Gemmataceae bacterium]